MIHQRNPTEAELFQGFARAVVRLADDHDAACDVIQSALAESPDFKLAAQHLGVSSDDLITTFQTEMSNAGFDIRPKQLN